METTTIKRSPNDSFITKSSKNVSQEMVWTSKHNKKLQNITTNIENDRPSSSCSTSSSVDIWENEIPIWVKNEQRWISGINDKTTCYDLIKALLNDEDTIYKEFGTNNIDDYIITERWRRVEQILDGHTKILKIWSAWGEEQSEARLTLRTVDFQRKHLNAADIVDSGRGSPIGSINSAIERRKRHRASKSTSMWMIHAQTPHPKSQKAAATIEKLMKLILEQGETIQNQLVKLKDREIEIYRIEEDRHKLREKRHGKNYLLETYLNDIHELTPGHSDSGVNTEDTNTSPEEIGILTSTRNECNDYTYVKRKSRSSRESELMKEHETTKDLRIELDDDDHSEQDDVSSQIDMLEKIVILNKRLQHEEELLVRLNAKIKRYESENQTLSENDMKEAINRIDTEISQNNTSFVNIEQQIQNCNDILTLKTNLLCDLTNEIEIIDNNYYHHQEDVVDVNINNTSSELIQNNNNINISNINNNNNNNMCNEITEFTSVENLLLTTINPPPQFSNNNNNNTEDVQINLIPNHSDENVILNKSSSTQQHQQFINSNYFNKSTQYLNSNSMIMMKSLSTLEKCDQRNLKNVLINSNEKLIGPKKFINNNNNNNNNDDDHLTTTIEFDKQLTNINDINFLHNDMTTLGTLV